MALVYGILCATTMDLTRIPACGCLCIRGAAFVLCLIVTLTGCSQRGEVQDTGEPVPANAARHAVPEPVKHDEQERELTRLREQVGELEAKVDSLEQQVAELDAGNRLLVREFQEMELAEMVATLGADTPVRSGVLGGSSAARPSGTIYFWDKPGGYGSGARVAGQAKVGERVVIGEESRAAGKRWSQIHTTAGTNLQSGWVPSDLVSETPSVDDWE